MKKYFVSSLIVLVLFAALPAIASQRKDVLDKNQIEFLDGLMRDTFRFMHESVDPVTSLTGNTQGDTSFVNSTPIGLHIASLAIGSELGLIDADEAAAKFEKVLDTMEKIHFKQDGFFPNFIKQDLTPQFDSVMIISDYNFYPIGMVVARQVWPQYEERITKYLDSIKWDKLYNKEANRVISGYDLATGKAANEGLWVASDARGAVVMMVGSGAVPPKVWDGMVHTKMETEYGSIYTPGMNFGGTYIAGITGLFMYESDLVDVGSTVGNMGWFQYEFSRKRNYPLWGWSNCFIVGRSYSVAGLIPEWNISPHSLSMLLEYYPRHVTAALQKMDKMGGRIPPAGYEGKDWGLLGCYDMERNLWGDYYVSLEQGMMFVGLANLLHDDIAKKLFTQDPLIKKGLELSKPYLKHDPKLLKRWAKRDAEPIVQTRVYQKDPWERGAENVVEVDLSKMKSNNPNALKVKSSKSGALIKGSGGWTAASVTMPINPLDIANLDRVEFEFENFKVKAPSPGSIRFQMTDKYGQSRWSYITLEPGKKHYSVRARDIYCFTFDDIIESITLSFERESWFYQNALFNSSEFTLRIKAIRIILKEPSSQ
jgi:hypothetical protein